MDMVTKPSTIEVTCTLVKCIELFLHWKIHQDTEIDTVQINVTNMKTGQAVTFFQPADKQNFLLPVRLSPGDDYSVKIIGYAISALVERGNVMYRVTASSELCFIHAELQAYELRELMVRAEKHTNSGRPLQPARLCQFLYRNKPPAYFTDIFHKHDGVMEAYTKDFNGDPGSPINGRINGLFFGTSIDVATGLPPNTSHFGQQRININSEVLFHGKTNLFFADFYCNNVVHYVTLVLTTSGTPADDLCKKKLLQLDVNTNPFFFKQRAVFAGMQINAVFVTQNVWVEILYTNSINIEKLYQNGTGFFTVVDSTGTSRRGGIPKNPSCKICNLYV